MPFSGRYTEARAQIRSGNPQQRLGGTPGLCLIITAFVICLSHLLASDAAADIRLPKIFSDRMVLQRDQALSPYRLAGISQMGATLL